MENPDLVVFIANSNVKHKLSDSEYPKRKAACETAVRALTARYPEVKSLRDATLAQLEAIQAEVEDVVFKRARHVIGEIVSRTV